MRTKALILGGMPPMEGPWVTISEAAAWKVVTRTMPHSEQLLGRILIEVRNGNGESVLLPPGSQVHGSEARAIVREAEDTVVTVHLESVED